MSKQSCDNCANRKFCTGTVLCDRYSPSKIGGEAFYKNKAEILTQHILSMQDDIERILSGDPMAISKWKLILKNKENSQKK